MGEATTTYSSAIGKLWEQFNEHYSEYIDCKAFGNLEGVNFHSGVMLGIANCAKDLLGDEELYSKYVDTVM